MDNYILITSDSNFAVNGIFRNIDISDIDSNIHAIQWNGEIGHIEYIDRSNNTIINSFNEYSFLVSRWEIANKKENKPNYYSTWDENINDWYDDLVLKTKLDLENELKKASHYLSNTDWVENYIIKHNLNIEILPADSNKFEIYNKREEYKKLLKDNNSQFCETCMQ